MVAVEYDDGSDTADAGYYIVVAALGEELGPLDEDQLEAVYNCLHAHHGGHP